MEVDDGRVAYHERGVEEHEVPVKVLISAAGGGPHVLIAMTSQGRMTFKLKKKDTTATTEIVATASLKEIATASPKQIATLTSNGEGVERKENQ
ncbi:hypothetical protein EJB05_40616, partial [Eragrostis curvula]